MLEDVLFEWHNSSNARRQRGAGELCSFQRSHLSSSFFFFFSSAFWSALSAVCLFICFFFFFCSPVLKGDESILCFSVWEKFQQQTFCSPPLFTGAKRSSAIFAAGETRRGEASGNARSLARSMFGCWWRWGRCEKINGFVLYRLAAVQKPSLIFTFPPPEKKNTHT